MKFFCTFFSLFVFIFSAAAQQTARNEDGTFAATPKKEISAADLLCGKDWKWIEGIEGNQSFEAAVFSFRYDSNGTFMFNQREQKNFWKIEGGYLYHSVAGFGGKKKNPYGVFEGKFEITKMTDSLLVLTKAGGKKDNPATQLRLVHEDAAPEKNYSYVRGIQHRISSKTGEWEVDTEPGAIVHWRKIGADTYKKKVSSNGAIRYFRNDQQITCAIFNNETGLE